MAAQEEHGARSFEEALARLRAAIARLATGDVAPIKALYSHAPDATAFFGWGGAERGWDEVSKRWDWAGRQFKGGTVRIENLTTVVAGDLAYTTDIESYEARVEGNAAPTQWTNRVTHVFRRENGEWRLVHRHANRLEARYEPSTRMK